MIYEEFDYSTTEGQRLTICYAVEEADKDTGVMRPFCSDWYINRLNGNDFILTDEQAIAFYEALKVKGEYARIEESIGRLINE